MTAQLSDEDFLAIRQLAEQQSVFTQARVSHFQLAPDRTCMAANSRSALDVAIATPPSVQEFSLIQEHPGINLKVRNSCQVT